MCAESYTVGPHMYHPMRFGESVWKGVFVFVNVFRIEGGWRPDDDDDDAFFSSSPNSSSRCGCFDDENSSSSHHAVGAQQMHDGPEKDKKCCCCCCCCCFFEAEKAPPPPVRSPDMSLFFSSISSVFPFCGFFPKKFYLGFSL